MNDNEELTPKARIRKGVLEALLKVYNAKEMAELEWCPLCENRIGEYTWTFTNFEKGLDPIGISGVQCSNQGCLLHNGIIYEDEGKRLAKWQSSGGKNPVIRGLEGDEKDPNRFSIQLWAEQETIKKAAGAMMTFEEVSVRPGEGEDSKDKMMRFEMKMRSRRPDAGTHASGWGHELFKAIEEMGYTICWMDADWYTNQLTIIIRKDVWI